jgi:hypothetical protein
MSLEKAEKTELLKKSDDLAMVIMLIKEKQIFWNIITIRNVCH